MRVGGPTAVVSIPVRVDVTIVLSAALVVGAGLASGVAATATSTSTPPTVAGSTTTAPATAAASTTAIPTAAPTTTTTRTLPPVDLLAGIPWIQRTFASPCSDGAVQMIGGTAIDGGSMAVIDDVVPLDASAGLAVAFLSCQAADGSTSETTVVLVEVGPTGVVQSVAEENLGGLARIVDVQLPAFTVELPDGAVPAGSCCAPFVWRRRFSVGADGFSVTDDQQLAAFEQTVPAAPVVGGDGDLVRTSVPPAALCYRWDNVYLSPADPASDGDGEAGPTPITAPSAELQTIRLALIHITEQWIAPSSQMSQQMSAVVASYQESRGLTVDGSVGAETTAALAADLGCPASGSFDQVMPPALGPRRFASVTDLLIAAERYATEGSSGNTSLDELLRTAGWDGLNALFLGCSRWESPSSGMSCSWSGTTPLQLIGLLEDPAAAGVAGFSILYARSATTG